MVTARVSHGRIVWRQPQLHIFLNEPTGKVGEYLWDKSMYFIIAAKRQVGVRTRDLQSSINIIEKRSRKGGQTWKIGSKINYAYWHHEGTLPHIIRGKRKNQYRRRVLRFTRGGTVVFANSVRHPGTRPNKFLSDNLPIFVT
jgi:hypothetical protein